MFNNINFLANKASIHAYLSNNDIEADFVSPNMVADIASKFGIELTSAEVVEISDSYEV